VLYWESNRQKQMTNKTEEVLVKCVVDTLSRKFYLYSNEGSTREVFCETVDEFMNVLEVVRSRLHEDVIVYSNPF
jgi:hypothetical protein